MLRKFDIVLWVFIPALTVLTQASVKSLADTLEHLPFGIRWLQAAITCPYSFVIIICEILGFLLWLAVLSHTSLSRAMPITSLCYCLILLMGWAIFHEPVLPLQIIGSALILAGVWLIGTAGNQSSKEQSL